MYHSYVIILIRYDRIKMSNNNNNNNCLVNYLYNETYTHKHIFCTKSYIVGIRYIGYNYRAYGMGNMVTTVSIYVHLHPMITE